MVRTKRLGNEGSYGYYQIISFSICIGVMLILFSLGMIEKYTEEIIRTERAKCIDDVGAEFEDEYCIKEIKCGIIMKKIGKSYCYGEDETIK